MTRNLSWDNGADGQWKGWADRMMALRRCSRTNEDEIVLGYNTKSKRVYISRDIQSMVFLGVSLASILSLSALPTCDVPAARVACRRPVKAADRHSMHCYCANPCLPWESRSCNFVITNVNLHAKVTSLSPTIANSANFPSLRPTRFSVH